MTSWLYYVIKAAIAPTDYLSNKCIKLPQLTGRDDLQKRRQNPCWLSL